jgi:hypothetical protein
MVTLESTSQLPASSLGPRSLPLNDVIGASVLIETYNVVHDELFI